MAAVFALALGVRLLHVWEIRSAPFFTTLLGDSKAYDAWALRIAGGDWLGTEVFYQAPLYPYFLGALYTLAGRDLLTVRVVQAVIGSAACALLALAGSRWFSPRVGIAAGTGLALYAPIIFADALIQKTVLDVSLMCAALWLAGIAAERQADRRVWLALGAAVGLLSLTRENSLAIIGAILAWLLLRRHADRQRLAQAAIFLVGLAMVLAPVATRNAIVGGEFQLTTSQFGSNFYIGNHARADGSYVSLRFGRGDPEYERQDATELAERALGRTLSPGEVSAYWTRRAIEYIRAQPADWGALMARKAALLANATEIIDTESQQTHAESSIVLTVLGPVAHVGVLAPLALLGVCLTWARRRELSLLYWMLGAYAVSVVLFFVVARYRYPLVPFLMLLAAAAVVGARRFFRESGRARLATAVTMAAGFAVVCNWPLVSADLMRAITENNLGTALREAGRTDEAEAHYRRALEISPEYAAAHSNLGALLRVGGRLHEATAHYGEALRLQPDHPTARYNLANALLAEGRAADAAEQFRHALAQDPQSVEVHNNLGIALATAGRPEDAARLFRQALAIDPASAEAHVNLGKVLEELGAVDEALGHFRQAVAVRPDDYGAQYGLGRLLLARGDVSQAMGHLRRAVALDPQSADAHNNLGIALASSGQLDEAIAQFERAVRLGPDLAEARRNLAAARAARPR